jgi:hypothetical protein
MNLISVETTQQHFRGLTGTDLLNTQKIGGLRAIFDGRLKLHMVGRIQLDVDG